MAKPIVWPWNRPWPWILFMAVTLLVVAPLWASYSVGCADYVDGVDDPGCTVRPLLGYEVTAGATVVAIVLLIRFSVGLVRALSYSRRTRVEAAKRR